MRSPLAPGGRVVVKVGSSSLVAKDGELRPEAIQRTAAEVAQAWKLGFPTTLVTSGAVASGMSALGRITRPTDLPGLQAAAAVGQGRLMHRYSEALESHGLVGGQVLLTRDVLSNREQYLHARRALDRMLSQGIVPVVNENDTIILDELSVGDNDRLAAIVSHLIGADRLVILTDTVGLFSSDPRRGEAEFLAAVDHADQRLDALTGSGPFGSGGVASKVVAARMAAWSQIPTVIASAESRLVDIIEGGEVGTWVAPRERPLPARKLWIAFGQQVGGTVTIDEGAVEALTGRGTSLLPVGMVEVVGDFEAGDAIDVCDSHGRLIGRGLARMSATALSERVGTRGNEPAIHRDDMVVFV